MRALNEGGSLDACSEQGSVRRLSDGVAHLANYVLFSLCKSVYPDLFYPAISVAYSFSASLMVLSRRRAQLRDGLPIHRA